MVFIKINYLFSTKLWLIQGGKYVRGVYVYVTHVDVCDLWALKHERVLRKNKNL